jgi:cobalamin biosynthesis protein CobT
LEALKASAEDLNADIDDVITERVLTVPARKYTPFSREYDEVVDVHSTNGELGKYQKTADDLQDIIAKTRERLRRLWSPVKTNIKVHSRRGRIDPRQAYKIALAGKGLPVDVKHVWRDIKTTRTPQVAVSILWDCSRSMDKIEGVSIRAAQSNDGAIEIPVHRGEPEDYEDRELECGVALWTDFDGEESDAGWFHAKTIDHPFRGEGSSPKRALRALYDAIVANGETRRKIARKAIVALSEVLGELNIPYEVIGHTTNSNAVPELDLDGENPVEEGIFSRFAPFRGYIFKSVAEKESPASVFSPVEAQDNLDGEAVLWATERLSRRTEKTKILVVITDGHPFAKFSNEGELQRHLYLTCKQVEARERDGMFLWGLGIGPRVRDFFKNADVLNDVDDLPEATLGIVEHVLCELKGTLG